MALPARIRVNTALPFPSLVKGSGPITIAKVSGVWIVGFSIANLGASIPLAGSYATDYLIVYDSVLGAFVKVALSSLPAFSGARQQRYTTATPIVVAASDQIINCNINAPATCALPDAASRNGAPLTFKDVGAKAFLNPIGFSTTGGQTIDGAANFTLDRNRQSVTFVPFNDGTNTGWFIT